MPGIGSARTASYLLFAGVLAMVIHFSLGPAVIAALFSFTILDVTHRGLVPALGTRSARWIALAILTVTALLATTLTGRLLRQSLSTIPVVAAKAVPIVSELAVRYRVELPFDNIDELREVTVRGLKENAANITHASGLLTTGFFHIVIAIFAAVLCFMSESRAASRQNLYDALGREVTARVRGFMLSFERILGAQVLIAAINTTLTGIFLLVMEIPYAAFLIPATFILGLLPVVGNIISNTMIVGTALTLSLRHAGFSLGFLVLIHKGEYFLNSRIIGSSLQVPMWQTLLGILVGEVVLGVPGIILAPAMLHFLREEAQAVPVSER